MEGDKMRLKGLLQPLKESDNFVQVINSIKNNSVRLFLSTLTNLRFNHIL